MARTPRASGVANLGRSSGEGAGLVDAKGEPLRQGWPYDGAPLAVEDAPQQRSPYPDGEGPTGVAVTAAPTPKPAGLAERAAGPPRRRESPPPPPAAVPRPDVPGPRVRRGGRRRSTRARRGPSAPPPVLGSHAEAPAGSAPRRASPMGFTTAPLSTSPARRAAEPPRAAGQARVVVARLRLDHGPLQGPPWHRRPGRTGARERHAEQLSIINCASRKPRSASDPATGAKPDEGRARRAGVSAARSEHTELASRLLRAWTRSSRLPPRWRHRGVAHDFGGDGCRASGCPPDASASRTPDGRSRRAAPGIGSPSCAAVPASHGS